MALTGSHATQDGRVSPNAYAVPKLELDHVMEFAIVTVRIWHDESARRAGKATIDTLTEVYRTEPQSQLWDEVEKRRIKAEDTAESWREKAELCISLDPENTRGRDDLLALAEAAVPAFEAARDELLGENWRERYPVYSDLFAAEKQGQGGALAAWYEWAAKWHPIFSTWQKA